MGRYQVGIPRAVLAPVLIAGLLLACAPSTPQAPATERTVAQIGALNGPDRQAILEAGARKEGQLMWYTALIVNQAVRPLVEGFNKKYPYINVSYHRADGSDIIQRVISEHQARRFDVDLVDGTTSPPALKAAGLLERYDSPFTAAQYAETKDPQGYWYTSNLYFLTAGINTRMVPREEAPKTYEDLLHPRWKDQMGWSTSSGAGGPTLVGNALQTMGQERGMAYIEQLSKQGIRNSTASARAVLDQVIAGEYPISLMIFNHHTVISAAQGAPTDWIPLEPVPALLNAFSLAKQAPHPYSAMLFLDFVLSEEGQRVLQQADYLPAHPQVPAKTPSLKPEQGNFKVNFINPEEYVKQERQWDDIFRRLFLQSQ